MTLLARDIEAASTAAAQGATRLAFLICGVSLAAWAPLVPFVKARAELGDGPLGLLLLCLGVGSILAMPLAGAAVTRLGVRAVFIIGTLAIGLTLPLLATLSQPLLIAPVLLVFGGAIGAIDCAANIQAVIVERAAGRPMMSGFHGLFSVGGIVGAAGVSALLGLGISPGLISGAVVILLLAVLAGAVSGLLRQGGQSGGPAFALPRGIVLLIGLFCFVVFLTEGSALDWGAVFLIQVRGLDPSWAGLGYAAFATLMTLGRLFGDRLVRRVGRMRILVVGSLAAAAGLAIAALVPAWPLTILGYALVGAGCANMVPVLYTAVAQQDDMPESLAIPAVTTLGYAGILAGPAAIGAMAQAAGLPVAFLLVALLLVGVAAGACALRV